MTSIDRTSPKTPSLLNPIPGVRQELWSYDNTGRPESLAITWVDGDTTTLTDPTALAALSFSRVGEQVWSYDDTGAPQSVTITSVDGQTATLTHPTAIAALTGR